MRYTLFRSKPYCSTAREGPHLAFVALLLILSLSWIGSFASDLSGEWESIIAIEPATGNWSIETDVTFVLEFADWMTTARTLFEDGEWKSQEFDVEGRIGEFDIKSDLRFEPYKHRFRDWITDFEWDLDELAFTLTTKLTRTTDWLILELEREWDEVEVGTSFRMRAPTGSCALAFYDVSADVAFHWCGIATDLEVAFDDDGFDEFIAKFSDLSLARIPWATFDLEITRTPEKRTVKLSPEVVLESSWCATFEFRFEGDLPDKPNLFPISIDEASLAWEIGEWEIDAHAILDPSDWIDDLYWLEIETTAAFDLAACGEVSLDLALLWSESGLGRARSVLTYEPSDRLAIAIDWDVDLAIGRLDRLALELQLEW